MTIATIKTTSLTTVRTPETVLAEIAAWPHWAEIGLVAKKEYGVSEEQYKALLPEYQRFMALIILGHHGLGMFSAEIDQVWHSHILSTHRYADFCAVLNGKFINHIPQLAPKAKQQCTVCQSCKGCNAKCKGCQGQAQPGHDSAEYFTSAYLAAFGELPGIVWGLAEADGITA